MEISWHAACVAEVMTRPVRHALAVATLFASSLLAGCSGPEMVGDDIVEDADELRVCAKGPTVEGIDVSYYQGTVNWSAVRAAGRRFGIARISDGTRFSDPTFQRNWVGMKDAGLIRGAYQFFRPGQDPVVQADMVVRAVGRLGAGDLPVVLDLEDSDGQPSATVMSRALTWIQRVQAGTGKRPILYTSVGFLDTVRGTAPLNGMILWVANYGVACPYLPSGFANWQFWQYTDRGRVSGVSGNVDANVFNGTYAQLEALANGGAVVSPPPAASTKVSLKWTRDGDTWAFDASSEPNVAKVVLDVEGFAIGEATAATSFDLRYRFNYAKEGRGIAATAYDAQGRKLGVSVGLIDSTQGSGRVAVQPRSDGSWEFALEEAPSGVASIEVRADGYLLRDGATGATRSTRKAVRSVLTTKGTRQLEIRTFDASGRQRGTLRRAFVNP
jgi:GH25 family lysozyme M1 (1,4-beta-N-acetylmuramidase)